MEYSAATWVRILAASGRQRYFPGVAQNRGSGAFPAFSGAETAYTLVLEPGETAVTITYRATNRNFQARAYKSSYAPTAKAGSRATRRFPYLREMCSMWA